MVPVYFINSNRIFTEQNPCLWQNPIRERKTKYEMKWAYLPEPDHDTDFVWHRLIPGFWLICCLDTILI